MCERWLNVLVKHGGFFFSLPEEMYSLYIHSCRPFIEVWFFCSIGGLLAEQEGSLLSGETQINCALNQINAHLKWAVSLNSLKMSTYSQFALSTQAITLHSSALCLRIFVCWCLPQAEEEEEKVFWFSLYICCNILKETLYYPAYKIWCYWLCFRAKTSLIYGKANKSNLLARYVRWESVCCRIWRLTAACVWRVSLCVTFLPPRGSRMQLIMRAAGGVGR